MGRNSTRARTTRKMKDKYSLPNKTRGFYYTGMVKSIDDKFAEKLDQEGRRHLSDLNLANGDLFLDSNLIFGFNVLKDYAKMVSYYLGNANIGYRNGSFSRLLDYVEELSTILKRDNVFVTSGVLGEFREFRRNIKDEIKEKGLTKSHGSMLEPLDLVYELFEQCNNRLNDLEEDPLVERICELIPNEGYEGSEPPSEVDKKIIAVPLVSGLYDEKTRNKYIFSCDGGIRQGLIKLQGILERAPERLNVTDLVGRKWPFYPVSVGVFGKGVYYPNFFKQCYLHSIR